MTDKFKRLKDAILPPDRSITEQIPFYFLRGYNEALWEVSARLDKLLEDAVEVSGWYINPEKRWTSGSTTKSTDTHSALLLMIEPLKKPKVTREEIKNATAIRTFNDWEKEASHLKEILMRIERDGIE